MKKILKRFVLLLLVLLVLAVAFSVIATSLFGNKIGNRILTEINKQITSELFVEKFDLSLIRSFPNLSANLRNIKLLDTRGETLIEAERLSVNLGLIPLLTSKVDVRSVILSDGKARLNINGKGKANYLILNDTNTGTADSKASTEVKVNKAMLRNIDFDYNDETARQNIGLWIEDASFSGGFSDSQFSLESEAKLLTQKVGIGDKRYLAGKDIDYKAQVDIDLENRRYDLRQVMLNLGNNEFNIAGSIEEQDQGTYLDLALSNDQGNLAALLQLLPDEMLGGLARIKSRGDLDIEGSIKGLANANQQPAIKMVIELDQGEIRSPELAKEFEDISLKASYDNGRRQNSRSSVFEIGNLVGYFGSDRLEARLRYEDFTNPLIDFALDGILPMAALYSLMPNEKITKGSGEVVVKDLKINGLLDDLQTPSRLSKVQSSGQIEFQDASLTYSGEELTLEKGQLKLQDNALEISDLAFQGAGSDLSFRGSAYNIIPVLFADSVNSKRAELEFNADLRAKSIDLDRLLALNAIDSTSSKARTGTIDSLKEARVQKREKVTNFLVGNFNAIIDDFNYDKIKAKDFSGKIEFVNTEMDISGSATAMDGEFKMQGQIFFEDEPRLIAKLTCLEVNANEFFKQTDNFGQEVLLAKNIQGNLNAKILINAFWDKEGNLQDDRMRVLAGVGIMDGELNNFAMLQQFSSFVKIQDLMKIKFSNLQNFLEYRRNKLTLPVMFIQSNAMNLTINGEHTYNNEIYYNIKVNAGQVLANKFKRHDPNLKPLKARKKGFFNLYYNIYGDVENYEIKSAKREVREDFDRSSRRKREIQLALEEAFGIVELVEEPIEWRDIPEYDNSPEAGGEEEFIDWEEGHEEGEKKKNNKKNNGPD